MPSTEYFGTGFENVGPLTTTFSAASSCATDSVHRVAIDDGHFPLALTRYTECGPFSISGDCRPSASAYNSIRKEAFFGPNGNGRLPYHSPGLVCPSGWTTAGAASQDSRTLSATGIFASDRSLFEDDMMIIAASLPMIEAFIGALQDDETVVWCCPSGHSANVQGNCVSTIGPFSESFSISTVCELQIPRENIRTVTSFDGTIWDPPLQSYVDDADTKFVTSEVTLTTDKPDQYQVAVVTPILGMYYKDSDREAKTTIDSGDSGSADDDYDDEDDDSGDDDEDAAPSLHPVSQLSLAVVVIGLLASSGLLMAW